MWIGETDEGDASPEASVPDAGTCSEGDIRASSYDPSCVVDTDCRAISVGNACTPCAFTCSANVAISAGALAKYASDVARTPAVLGAAGVGCPACEGTVSGNANEGPFCCGGTCHMGSACPVPGDAGAACTAAGGQCVFGGCANAGPQACGSAGMFCCLGAIADAAVDAVADACPVSACIGACLSGAHNVSHVVDGCTVWQCCVVDDAGP